MRVQLVAASTKAITFHAQVTHVAVHLQVLAVLEQHVRLIHNLVVELLVEPTKAMAQLVVQDHVTMVDAKLVILQTVLEHALKTQSIQTGLAMATVTMERISQQITDTADQQALQSS